MLPVPMTLYQTPGAVLSVPQRGILSSVACSVLPNVDESTDMGVAIFVFDGPIVEPRSSLL